MIWQNHFKHIGQSEWMMIRWCVMCEAWGDPESLRSPAFWLWMPAYIVQSESFEHKVVSSYLKALVFGDGIVLWNDFSDKHLHIGDAKAIPFLIPRDDVAKSPLVGLLEHLIKLDRKRHADTFLCQIGGSDSGRCTLFRHVAARFSRRDENVEWCCVLVGCVPIRWLWISTDGGDQTESMPFTESQINWTGGFNFEWRSWKKRQRSLG